MQLFFTIDKASESALDELAARNKLSRLMLRAVSRQVRWCSTFTANEGQQSGRGVAVDHLARIRPLDGLGSAYLADIWSLCAPCPRKSVSTEETQHY